ncbi:protein NETWORKED 4B-like [Cynara cardunculus var. scolymus]|uniref:KIP1-like protein n=1 Tax=Cynara cardunculus var. scolymus TaxID=59895 RepID=A0A103YJ19_CYNCS|nr:protein NETWORKED 4B-like [Cynara cardunculus var. scolymus]KVI10039.1 KIP1-like protein [Cynara cardunculus var. scolymus]
MEGVESKITPENFTCLAENVEGFQKCVEEILKLIEWDGDFFEMTAEIYDHKKSELTTQVAELSRMYTALADQHGHLIGEFSRNCPSGIKKQHLDASDSSSPQVTQMFTPDQMSNTHKFRTPIGFDVLLSSGGAGSYISRREGSESSFSLSSDSDSESFMSTNKLLISPVNDDASKVKETKVSEVLLKKFANLEEELVSLNTKLQTLEDENTKLKSRMHENESVTEIASDMQSQLELAQDDIRTQNAYLEAEKAKVVELQKQVADLKLVISDSSCEIEIMGVQLKESKEKLLAAEDEISKLKHELGSTEQEMALLQRQFDSEKDKVLVLQEEVSLCVADISVREDQITELNNNINQSISQILLLKSTHEAKEDRWNTDIERLKMELREKYELADNLNKEMDALKQKRDAVMVEKDGVKAQLHTLQAEMCSQDNLIRELENRLNALQFEHVGLLASFDSVQKDTNELRLKVVELEAEVDRQQEVISDRAEEKREAIRQLSFSLEHYMSGYKELRQAFTGHKRQAVLTS